MAGIPYYNIVPCCSSSGTALDFFNFMFGDALPNGTYVYTGPTITSNGLTFTSGYCYAINGVSISLLDYPDAPGVSSFTLAADCSDILCYDCESPILQYYTINDCCTGEPVEYPLDYELQGVIYLVFNGNCFKTACPDDLIGLTITEILNEAGINLTGCLELTEIPESEIPIGAITTGYENVFEEVVTVLTCQDCVQCSDVCYILTDCEDVLDPIYTLSSGVSPFVGGVNSIIINGYTNCWTVAVSEDTCDCAINVVVTQNFTNCELCLGYTSYKLTDCNNAAIIKYTTDDLSTYVGKVVELDCGGCWTVELINIIPPSDVPITILYTYDTCDSCNQEYWRLIDCAEVEKDIITITDLSVYDGQVITLTWCPTICWTVESTRVATDATIVFVDGEYETCQDCITAVNPCLCSTVTAPGIAKPAAYGYIDCDGNQQFTDILFPGQTSEKVCARTWSTENLNITYYGPCEEFVSRTETIYSCPVVPLPKRSVTPGYNTPACTVEYFDKVSCNFANVMYSIALEERYGITSCCAEDLEKWEIKYELLMMAAMLDPDYVCTPSSTCCEPGLPKSTGTCNS
jgi:hypothetical protein